MATGMVLMSGGLLPLFDVFSFWSLFMGVLFLLVLLEVPVLNQYLDCIFEMDAILNVVPMDFIEPTVFTPVGSWFERCLLGEAYPNLFEFGIGAFR